MLLLSNKLYRIEGKLVLASCFATLPVIISSYLSCRIQEARKVMFVWEYDLNEYDVNRFEQYAQDRLFTLELSFIFILLVIMHYYGLFCENRKTLPQVST